ncbi:class I SAM-dependent methyltransferase [Paenacidovorax monticola]|uniref:Class I SAM-dependent methyltransferase n=1 Tax=Paenacidovorax monticola TaxID=1926868 RepID=A0A7H0HHK9_9BURK|nr:class I SAM-dependent methyltransferase [Paenacidovorax monticola]QNP60025.1 class I SAM-dependent methyltransferase [Paenacidovorax monticola]
MSNDPFAQLKAIQREGWSLFAPLESVTTATAAELVKHARIRAEQVVLDVGCGTGVVALTAARAGAKVHALDLSPVLIQHGRQHAALAGVEIEFREGDVEALPYESSTFDAVVSQFGHMFAPRPDVTIAEMLRVLKPGGTIAFSTWPPEHYVGQMFALVAKFVPPPPGAAPPPQWGDPGIIRQRLGDAVTEIMFDRSVMLFPALSPQHYRKGIEETLGPVVKLVAALKDEPAKLAAFRAELDGFVARYFENNVVRQHYLMTRATKK